MGLAGNQKTLRAWYQERGLARASFGSGCLEEDAGMWSKKMHTGDGLASVTRSIYLGGQSGLSLAGREAKV